MCWTAVIMGATALYGAYQGRKNEKKAEEAAERNDPYNKDPHARWLSQFGEQSYKDQYAYAKNMRDNPRGLGDAKQGMKRNVVGSAGAGYKSAQRNIRQGTAQAGLSEGGGQFAARSYLAGNEFAAQKGQGLNEVDMLDQRAQEEQRARAENLMMALTNSSPAYAQIASQNYWNSLNYAESTNDAYSQALGQGASAFQDWYNNRGPADNPYDTGQNTVPSREAFGSPASSQYDTNQNQTNPYEFQQQDWDSSGKYKATFA